MSWWKRMMGGKGGGDGDGPPPEDATTAWVREQLAGLAVPSDLATRGLSDLIGRVARVLEAAALFGGEPRAATLWGKEIPRDVAPALFATFHPIAVQLASEWRAALVRRFGEPGEALYVDAAARVGLEKPRQSAHPPGGGGGEREPFTADDVEAAERDELLVLERDGDVVVGATIRTGFDADFDAEEALIWLLESEHASTLRKLTLGLWSAEGDADYGSAVAEIASRGAALSALESLVIGDYDTEESEISWTTVGDVGALWSKLPGLRSLRLRGGGIALGTVAHDRLESLTIETGGLPAGALASLDRARLPALHTLEVWFGQEGYGAEGDIEMLRNFFRGEATPHVRRLGLKNAEFSDDLAEALVGSPLASRVEVLDLGMGTLTARGARALADGASKLVRLERFLLDHSFVGADGAAALRGAFGARLELGELCEPDTYGGETHYYTSVGE